MLINLWMVKTVPAIFEVKWEYTDGHGDSPYIRREIKVFGRS